jgi:hypothetical protein
VWEDEIEMINPITRERDPTRSCPESCGGTSSTWVIVPLDKMHVHFKTMKDQH